MTDMTINPGSGNPFLAISQITDGWQTHAFIHDVTPDQLRRLADELEAKRSLKTEEVA